MKAKSKRRFIRLLFLASLFPVFCLVISLADEAASGSEGMEIAGPGASPAIDLQAVLDAIVGRNRGYGGGVFRLHSPTRGLLFEGSSGYAVRQPPVPMQLYNTFEIASMTKTFTAVTVLLLMENGLLELDEPIGTYLPSEITSGLLVIGGHEYGPEITVRQLLNHTGGLPDYWYDPPYIIS